MALPRPEIITIGAPSGPRHQSFTLACVEELGYRPRSISWAAFLDDPAVLDEEMRPNSYLRFDTPDQDVADISALYRAGEDAAVAAGIETVPAGSEARLAQGAIGSPAQLAFGLIAAITAATAIARYHDALTSTTPEDVALAFDKTATLERLGKAGIATPRCLPPVAGFDSLVTAMEVAGLTRVFVKLRHGSAAAGMIALARHGDSWIAVTGAMLDESGGLHATRRVARLTDRKAIARLVDCLAPLGLHVESWLPKIGIGNRVADVRLVMIEGGGLYPVLRTSNHPMTNLHLGGERASIDLLIHRIGRDAWQSVIASTRSASRCFPGSHVLGLDVAVLADARSHALLEANAFGDFVKELTVDGLCPHRAQVRRIAERLKEGRTTSAQVAA